jgi:hypothetical protein
VIEIFLIAAGDAVGVGEGEEEAEGAGAGASCDSFTLIFGVEKVKPAAVIFSQPSLSLMTVVATEGVPSELETSIFAWIGAEPKPYKQRATSERRFNW